MSSQRCRSSSSLCQARNWEKRDTLATHRVKPGASHRLDPHQSQLRPEQHRGGQGHGAIAADAQHAMITSPPRVHLKTATIDTTLDGRWCQGSCVLVVWTTRHRRVRVQSPSYNKLCMIKRHGGHRTWVRSGSMESAAFSSRMSRSVASAVSRDSAPRGSAIDEVAGYGDTIACALAPGVRSGGEHSKP